MSIDTFWEAFLTEKGLDKNTKYLDAFHFELTEYWANELLRLVLDGTKKATSSSLIGYEIEGDPVPEVGQYSIVTDWDGNPKCVIQTTNVRILPFRDITYDICKLEGEDDNLESWRNGHISFFQEDGKDLGYEFTEDMPVIFEEFEVVYRQKDDNVSEKEDEQLKVIDYFTTDNKDYWLEQIQKSDWNAGQYLYYLLKENKLKSMFGDTTKALLLVDDKSLISFCTLAKQDEVKDETMTPWIGFVYTFPQYRGKRYAGKLLEFANQLAKENGSKQIYISTAKIGVYEKYGYEFYRMMKDVDGEETRVYQRKIVM